MRRERGAAAARLSLVSAVLTGAAVIGLTSGCSDGGGEAAAAAPEPVVITTTTTAPAAADPAERAAAVLEASGLQLPDGAEDVTVTPKPKGADNDRYLVTFTAPRKQAAKMCTAAGLPTKAAGDKLPRIEAKLFGAKVPLTDARRCSGVNLEDLRRSRAVLYAGDSGDSGDSVRVWVAVWTTPAG